MGRTPTAQILCAQGLCFTFFAVALFCGGAAFPQEQTPKKEPPVKKVAAGRNVFVEMEGKKVVRVLVEAEVCLRKGSLEHLLTRKRCKEHEAILVADIDARDLHAALLLAGAEAGSPVLKPNLLAPTGSAVKISLAYKTKDGKEVKVSAREWIRDAKAGNDLATDWVFVGSNFVVDKDDPMKVYYYANDGDVICVANFEAACLDLPILSPADGANDYEANTDRIPPERTPVLVILEVVPAKKK